MEAMYEAREGEFRYTIELRTGNDGRRMWLWRVDLYFQAIAMGVSQRSHVHAQTQALTAIFDAVADQRSRVAAQYSAISKRPDERESVSGAAERNGSVGSSTVPPWLPG